MPCRLQRNSVYPCMGEYDNCRSDSRFGCLCKGAKHARIVDKAVNRRELLLQCGSCFLHGPSNSEAANFACCTAGALCDVELLHITSIMLGQWWLSQLTLIVSGFSTSSLMTCRLAALSALRLLAFDGSRTAATTTSPRARSCFTSSKPIPAGTDQPIHILSKKLT